MNLITLSLAPPGEESALVVVRRSERHRYFTELDDQHEAERVLLSGRPFRPRRGEIRRTEGLYACVHAERVRDVPGRLAERVTELVNRRELVGRTELHADTTATGRSVLDTFRDRGLTVRPVTITEADVRGALSRRRLEQTLVAVLEQERLEIARDLPLAGALADELKAQEGRLAVALMLAVWHGEEVSSMDPAAWTTVRR